ncbi:MAG TPA: intradiol ring-cleavage dioxygenase [Casimicrobiaceae bacterium]|nr:intradiol ring-cleavage dioxygenase [Casimicrobiaceae bacterium]
MSNPARRSNLGKTLALTAAATFPALRSSRALAQQRLTPTPRDAEGPFYPTRKPIDIDADLTRYGAKSAKGTPLELSGRVLDTSGAPLAGVRLELWQCDSLGRYHHVDGDHGAIDEGFQGYGVVTTDASGRYAFRTIRPVRYGGRPPHLHFKLAHDRAQALTTQIYPKGESAERGLGFGLSGGDERAKLEFAMTSKGGDGTLGATYDFVLARA